MTSWQKRVKMARKELARRGRLTSADLAVAVTRGERRWRTDELMRLGHNLAEYLIAGGFARAIGQTRILEWVHK
jgi:hypothetical protein